MDLVVVIVVVLVVVAIVVERSGEGDEGTRSASRRLVPASAGFEEFWWITGSSLDHQLLRTARIYSAEPKARSALK